MAVKELTNASFDDVVNGSDVPVLIDFYATWCGPCKMLSPIIEEISNEMEDKLTVCSVDVDRENALAVRFGISAVPTLIVMKNGEVSNMSAGYMPKDRVLAMI